MKKIAFITLGCKLNYAETSTYERGILSEAGRAGGEEEDCGLHKEDRGIHGLEIEVVRASEKADAYLVNTCSVTEHSDKKSRNIIRHLHRIAPDAAIFVTGCYAELRRAEIEAIEGVRAVFGTSEKAAVIPAVTNYLLELTRRVQDTAYDLSQIGTQNNEAGTTEPLIHNSEGENVRPCYDILNTVPPARCGADDVRTMFPAYSSGERTRSFLKVQDGCDFRCSYCTVPYARGHSRNIPIAEALRQAREIAATGIREIVLTGVNTGDFGRTTGESFLDLIRALNEVDGIERYRISSIEPNLLTEEMVDWIASGTKFLPHFHIPLQSGSDTILRGMGRRYSTADFERKINYIRQKMEDPQSCSKGVNPLYNPQSENQLSNQKTGLSELGNHIEGVLESEDQGRSPVFFGIDVIVGFPGETEELFEQTYSFLKDRIRPAFIHIFPYSRRAGTPAAARKDQVQDRIKTERVERLEALCGELHAEFIAKNAGRREKVLFESAEKGGMMFGYTGNYIRVRRPFDPSLIGQIVDVTVGPGDVVTSGELD